MMQKTFSEISKRDCPSEENLIRIKLEPIQGIAKLEFDISNRRLYVFHEGNNEAIDKAILDLNLGGEMLSSEPIQDIIISPSEEEDKKQRRLLWTVLIINFVFFGVEIFGGIISKSMGLVADSLDMLADSFVYGISLLAVGTSVLRKMKVAKLAGYFQILLAVIGFTEVLRRFFGSGELPDFKTMIIVSFFALIANAICLYLLQKSKSKDAHMQASMIFTSNDVVINLGVMLAAGFVFLLNSNLPDLVIGTIVFALVIRGALRILKLGK